MEVVRYLMMQNLAQKNRATVKSQYFDVSEEFIVNDSGDQVCASATVVKYKDRTLRLTQTMQEDELAPLFCGGEWAGTRLWQAAATLMDYVVDNYNMQDKVVLELGAGLGAPGMVCAWLGAKKAILTDVEEVTGLLRRNAEDNADHGCFVVEPLWWNVEGAAKLFDDHKIDYAICCDCIFEPLYGDCWKQLSEVVTELVQKGVVCLVSVERRNHDGVDKFLADISGRCSTPASVVLDEVIEDSHIVLYEWRPETPVR
mmetsp:Transcript_103691/g.237437  ORF Transcript_103691/g.237437 Transcript_103691/m.237437 type:complete len:257 (+) Transcript_103691:18-788(+)